VRNPVRRRRYSVRVARFFFSGRGEPFSVFRWPLVSECYHAPQKRLEAISAPFSSPLPQKKSFSVRIASVGPCDVKLIFNYARSAGADASYFFMSSLLNKVETVSSWPPAGVGVFEQDVLPCRPFLFPCPLPSLLSG